MNRFDARLGVAIVVTAIAAAVCTVIVERTTRCQRADPRVAKLEQEVDVLMRERAELATKADLKLELLRLQAQEAEAPDPSSRPAAPPAFDPSICDEVSCVLDNYTGACCAKYKKRATPAPAPKPRAASDVLDALGREEIKAGMDAVKAKVAACGRAGTTGRVKFAVKVAPSGEPSASIREAPDAALGECVRTAVETARFAKSVDGASFSYPYVF